MMENNFSTILKAYGISLDYESIQPYGSGNINKTFLVKTEQGTKFILQQINTSVFKEPLHIVENWLLAKKHLQKNHPVYSLMEYIPTLSGEWLYKDTDQKYWRLISYIDQSQCLETVSSEKQAIQAATAFAEFTSLLRSIDTSQFHTILNDFHNLAWRQQQFDDALKTASTERLESASATLSELHANRWITDYYVSIIHHLPLRIVHMDAKISNLLFDKKGEKVKCVIDLDTMMPGTILSDLGDMIRSMASPVGEDERETSKIVIRSKILEGLIFNYVAGIQDITPIEKENASFAGLMLVYMQALRFMTDFLQSDSYYTIRYPLHNLDRAKNQSYLLQCLLKESIYIGCYH
jgi:Ser/Thr protein kinase RdoA (MazF antagonist)